MAMIARDITKTITDFLTAGSGIAVLYGMPCVGKSCLLKQIADNRGAGYILADLTTDRELRSVLSDAICEKSYDSVIVSISSFFGLSETVFRETMLLLDGAEHLGAELAKLLTKDLPNSCMIATDRADLLANCLNGENTSSNTIKTFRITPLTFSEFLTAIGRNEFREIIRARVQDNKPIPKLLRDELTEQYYEYLLVGGFPQAVLQYCNDRTGIQSLRMIHRQILSTVVQSLSGAEAKLPDSVSAVRMKQILDYYRDHTEDTALFRPGTIRRGLTRSDFINEFRYMAQNGFFIPVRQCDPSDAEKAESEAYYVADSGLERMIANDYDIFFRIDDEGLPVRILRSSLYATCYDNGYVPVSYDDRKGKSLAAGIPERKKIYTYTRRKRKSAGSEEASLSMLSKQHDSSLIQISDDTSRTSDSNHNIMWYELDETLKSEK